MKKQYFLKQKLEKARWFIESLEAIFHKTLLNVMETIVDIQKLFSFRRRNGFETHEACRYC